jgi:hypothetical protein
MVTSGVNLRHARVTLLTLLLSVAPALWAQQATGLDLGGGIVANGEAERYLRVLQLLGEVPQHPVGIRPWTRHELRALTPTADHPWAARFAKPDSGQTRAQFTVLRPGARVTWNSTMPEGNDPVWFGRGVTVDASAGVRFTWGPLDVQLAPTVAWAQNQAFALAPNGLTGEGALRDARFPGNIDAPQRFGTTAYSRVDAGNSRIALETRIVSIGFSTAPLAWGPARDEPLVVGPNGGGFAHVYVGTGEPLFIGVGRVHLKLLAGRLEQSQWSPVQSGDRSRFGAAVVGTFEPRGVRGLELGAVRFEHLIWRPGTATLRNALFPFTGVLSNQTNNLNSTANNGYASVFARWAVAPTGFEVYGEYGREDYAGNTRWLLLKPDDLGNLLLGVQRASRQPGGKLRVVRMELVNAELSSNERGQRGFATPIPPYTHSSVYQGHTVNGRFLGSATAYGGAGWRVAIDTYTSQGRRSVVIERQLLKDWLPVAPSAAGSSPEVRYGARYEWLHFLAGSRELGGSAGLSYTLNRNTVSHDDVVNLQASLQWRGW